MRIVLECLYSFSTPGNFMFLIICLSQMFAIDQRSLSNSRGLKIYDAKMATKTSQILHIQRARTIALHALHVHFSFLYISFTFSANLRREMTNRPYSYSRYWTGTSLQWRLMRGNLFKCKYFLIYSPALASIAS